MFQEIKWNNKNVTEIVINILYLLVLEQLIENCLNDVKIDIKGQSSVSGGKKSYKIWTSIVLQNRTRVPFSPLSILMRNMEQRIW